MAGCGASRGLKIWFTMFQSDKHNHVEGVNCFGYTSTM